MQNGHGELGDYLQLFHFKILEFQNGGVIWVLAYSIYIQREGMEWEMGNSNLLTAVPGLSWTQNSESELRKILSQSLKASYLNI